MLTHLPWPLLLLWLVYFLALSAWIILQKREPVTTLAWILSLALLPFVGLVIYHFLGPQRIRRQRLKRLRAKALLGSSSHLRTATDEISSLMRLGQGSTGFAASNCHQITLLVDGATTFDALLEAIAAARDHIHLEYYIFEPDNTGRMIRDALIVKAQAGIKVRLLVDALGSSRLTKSFLQPLRDAGGEIAFFHPLGLSRLIRPRTNLRSHRKIVVVDGRIGFTGGINIADNETLRQCAHAYHDLHIGFSGQAVRWLQLAFVEDWVYAGGAVPDDEGLWPIQTPGSIATQVIPAGPDSPWEPIHRLKVSAIHQARRRVWLATPYFVPGEAARLALTSAAQRGLDVCILVPAQSDSRLVSAAARSYFGEMLRAGIRVFEYPRMLHSKILLVDDDVCILGSSNFDNRSFRLNFELCVLIENQTLANSLSTVLINDMALAKEVKGRRRLTFLPRLVEALARLLSPVL